MGIPCSGHPTARILSNLLTRSTHALGAVRPAIVAILVYSPLTSLDYVVASQICHPSGNQVSKSLGHGQRVHALVHPCRRGHLLFMCRPRRRRRWPCQGDWMKRDPRFTKTDGGFQRQVLNTTTHMHDSRSRPSSVFPRSLSAVGAICTRAVRCCRLRSGGSFIHR